MLPSRSASRSSGRSRRPRRRSTRSRPPSHCLGVPDARDRVLAGAYACVGRFGMGKTTIDDVARASGVSRATIYRLFPGGRDQLLRETVGWEMNNFFSRLAEAVEDSPDLAT